MRPQAVEIIGLGEVLWDLFSDGKRLGGAPFNFTFHCHQLGHAAAMVSRVGDDDLGAEIRRTIKSLGLSDTCLQEDPDHPTGTVRVQFDERGQPEYTITPEVAWDYLAWDEDLEALCAGARVVCFGTLAQRHTVARSTIQRALVAARNALLICDINLRQLYYNRAVVEASLHASRWAKLNEDELIVLRELLGLRETTIPALLRELRNAYSLEVVALTRGERGCLVQSSREVVDLPGVPVKVIDTVGAGDAFTAGLASYWLEGRSLPDASAFANRLAARVAASAGGTPAFQRAEVEHGNV
jgi:fructokinase